MDRQKLISEVASTLDVPRKSVSNILECALDKITASLAFNEKVTLVKFGTFTTKSRSARIGRNPKTGEPINVPAKTIVKFKPSKFLKGTII